MRALPPNHAGTIRGQRRYLSEYGMRNDRRPRDRASLSGNDLFASNDRRVARTRNVRPTLGPHTPVSHVGSWGALLSSHSSSYQFRERYPRQQQWLVASKGKSKADPSAPARRTGRTNRAAWPTFAQRERKKKSAIPVGMTTRKGRREAVGETQEHRQVCLCHKSQGSPRVDGFANPRPHCEEKNLGFFFVWGCFTPGPFEVQGKVKPRPPKDGALGDTLRILEGAAVWPTIPKRALRKG